MTDQLPLDLPHDPAMDDARFLGSDSNKAIRALVEGWRDWPNRAAAIYGPPGSGKTHLARIWQRAVDGDWLTAGTFPLEDPAPPRAVFDLGADALPRALETPLFHALNQARERQGAFLIVAREAPARWPTALPDLASRLRALPAARAEDPDDALLAALFEKLFADRQIPVDQATLNYLASRTERSFAGVADLVDRIDKAALAGRRRVTIKLAGDVIRQIEGTDPDAL